MRNGIIIRRLENLRTFGNRGGAARLMTFAQGFSVVLGEVSQGRLGVFVDRANRRDKTGVEKRLHAFRSEEHTSELQSRLHLVCRLLLEKKKRYIKNALYIMKIEVLARG